METGDKQQKPGSLEPAHLREPRKAAFAYDSPNGCLPLYLTMHILEGWPL